MDLSPNLCNHEHIQACYAFTPQQKQWHPWLGYYIQAQNNEAFMIRTKLSPSNILVTICNARKNDNAKDNNINAVAKLKVLGVFLRG